MKAVQHDTHNHENSPFQPAFLDKTSGRVEIARLASGEPATCHLISWLPGEWATRVDDDGRVVALRDSVIAGFECDGTFYTRAQVEAL